MNLLYLFTQLLIETRVKIKGSFAERKKWFDSFSRSILNFDFNPHYEILTTQNIDNKEQKKGCLQFS